LSRDLLLLLLLLVVVVVVVVDDDDDDGSFHSTSLTCIVIHRRVVTIDLKYALSIINRWAPDISVVRDCYGGLYAGVQYNPTATGIYFVSSGVPSAGTGSEQLIYASILKWNQARSPQYQARIYSTALLAGSDSDSDKQATVAFMSQVAGAGKGVFRAIDTQ
jgi:hypothetical protein